MKDEDKTKEQLTNELAELRQRIAELEVLEGEHKKAEEALRNAEQEKAAILYSMLELVTYQDTEMRVLWVNRAARESVGLAPEQIVGRYCYELWQQRSEPCVDCPVVRARETNQPQEAEITTPDGRIWLIRGYPLRDANGDIIGMVETTLEITERKRAEEALRVYTLQWQTSFDALSDSICLLDLEGRFLRCNKATAELLGKPINEIIGRTCWELVHGTSEPIEGCPIVRMQETRRRESLVLPVDDRWLDVSVDPVLDENGKLIGAVHIISDISKRKAAEDALRKREKEHQIILDSVPIDIFHIDADSRFIHVNKALANRYRMTPEDFKGKTSRELFPEICEEYIKSDKEVLESGVPQTGVARKIRTPRGVRWMRLDKVPIKDTDGNVTGIIGFELDITKRIEAQEELRNAHKELQGILEFLPDATFVIDRDKKVIAWNRAIEGMTGVRKADIIGKGDYAYAVSFYGITRPILIDLIFLSDKEIESSYEYVKREGNTLFAEVFISSMYGGKGAFLWGTATPLLDSEGNIVGAIESIRDITEWKRAEEKFRKSEEEYRSLVESTEDSIYLMDRNCRYLFVNDKHLSRLGFTMDELRGRTYGELHPPEEAEELAEKVEEVFETGESTMHEHRSRRDNRYILRTLSPVKDSEGITTAVTVLSKDINELKRAEEKITATLREKEILLKEVHHRVKNNFQVISSLFNLQSERIEDKHAFELFKISQNRIKAMALIHAELYQSEDLARIDFAGYIRKLVTNLYSSYGVNFETIKLNINAPEVLLDVDTAIPCGLIINELVSNTLKYAFPDGKEGEIHIALRPDNNKLTLTISDNGVGFPKDLDFRNTKTLGMQLVISLTNQLDGTIELDKSGGRTTFYITFAKL